MTDKEIIQALRLCGKIDSNCRECKLWGDDRCVEHLAGAAADIIERLTAEVADLRKEIEWKDMVIALAQKEQAKAEAERDALREPQLTKRQAERILKAEILSRCTPLYALPPELKNRIVREYLAYD